uniref:Uncharacterized protein n=1 Tax=Arundo donax TaxID=35708 RepID=A0A0A9E7W8_ARUDO
MLHSCSKCFYSSEPLGAILASMCKINIPVFGLTNRTCYLPSVENLSSLNDDIYMYLLPG